MIWLLLAFALSQVMDGDTIEIDGQRIRIANIDAPELHRAQCDAEKRLARLARKRLHELLNGGAVVVHPGDPKDGRLKDRHGRALATITVDGRDVGAVLVEEGLAREWTGRREPWCE